jgi:pimeloyl-ACP methyl ester carboxylesterase/predicted glycosyltransferase
LPPPPGGATITPDLLMRALEPVRRGYAVRDGVRLAWEIFGQDEPTVFLLPTWSIIHSRHWKLQVPYLARHARVLTMDGRGNGGSDRPCDAAAYSDREFAADALAVMDATETERAALVCLSAGARWALILAAEHPGRVTAVVFIGPSVPLADGHPERVRAMRQFHKRRERYEGWTKYNANYWLEDHPGFLEFFFSRVFTEPHSTKPIEDCVGWGLDTDPQTLVATAVAEELDEAHARDLASRVRCPVLVIHGDRDEISPIERGQALAAVRGDPVLVMEGSGHCPHVRDPVAVNLALKEFLLPSRRPGRGRHSLTRPRRALFVSSPIGLGHVRRDIAIAGELRRLVPGLQIDWLAQHPVTRVLRDHGEPIHPMSALLASESRHIESESGEHRLHVFGAWRRMDEILLANFMVFHDLVEEQDYDLWIGDEAWELDHFLFENPSLKRAPFVWLTDFVGWLPMPALREADARLTSDYNAEMIEHVARYPRLRDLAVFIGRREDIVSDRFGSRLPGILDWTGENFRFSGGYALELEPGLTDRAELRRQLGYSDDEVVAVATVGGSGVGGALLRRLIDAFPQVRRAVPDLRLTVVSGPRLDPAQLPFCEGVEVRGFVPDLNRHLAACDVGLVQGGLTTTMELAAYQRPFLYFPLRDHCEQQFHVRQRLERYRAGHCMDFDAASPDSIAEAVRHELSRPPSAPVETGVAARVAGMIAELL